jgi:hypothetical protein
LLNKGKNKYKLFYDATSLAHLYLGSFSHADAMKLCQVGWGKLLLSFFQVSPELIDWVGPLKDIQGLVPKPHIRCIGCVLRVVVLLEGEPSPQV